MLPYLEWTAQAVDAELILLTCNLYNRYKMSCCDSFIVAAAQRERRDVLHSEDMRAGIVFDGTLRVVNPFVEDSDAPHCIQRKNPRYTWFQAVVTGHARTERLQAKVSSRVPIPFAARKTRAAPEVFRQCALRAPF